MKLIDFDGQEFKIADEALLIRPIRELFLADKSKRKELFWRQLSYLWFMCDPRSTYMYIIDQSDRSAEIKKQEGFGDDWQPSDLLKEAMESYKRQTITTSALLLERMRKGADSICKFLESVNLLDVDKNGKPVYQIASVTSALKQLPEIAKAISDAEKALARDFAEDDKTRGTSVKAVGEDI